jgi:nitrite reductase (NADH) small subunit
LNDYGRILRELMMAYTCDTSMDTIEVTLCRLDELPIGIGRAFDVAGRSVAVFRTRQGAIHAVQNTCPHRGGPLADGMLAAGRIVCPFHGLGFELSSGQCDQPDQCAIDVYATRLDGNQVILLLPSA